jgi:multimeric flavodoxin WrbA
VKIAILGGSPKGEISVTMQYVEFIRLEFPQHEYQVFQVSHLINKYENDRTAFDEVVAAVRAADAVLWAVPLYVYLVPSQYKRFIELIWERGAQDAFRGKYAAALTTSIHFFDNAAHEYLRATSEDLGMRFVGGHSPAMYDLMHREGRRMTRLFAEHLFAAVAEQWALPRAYAPATPPALRYAPGAAGTPIDVRGKKILVLHDARDGDNNLARMVGRVQTAFGGAAEVVSLHDLDLKGGCLGCIQCGYDGTCVYESKDGNTAFHATKIAPADIIVFAGSVVDRYLSSRWKMFFDRAFFHNHVPWLVGKHLAWVIAGPLAQNANLRQILQAIPDVQGGDLAGIVTDEAAESGEVDRLLDNLAARLVRQADEKYLPANMGPAVGGKKIFRDSVYGRLRLVFHADHVYFKEHGGYDFPQKNYRQRLMAAATAPLFWIPAFRKHFYQHEIKTGMVRPLKKVLPRAR